MNAQQWTQSVDTHAAWLEWLPIEQERQAGEAAMAEYMEASE